MRSAPDGHQYICFGKISGGAACGNGIGYYNKAVRYPLPAFVVVIEVHHIAIGEAVSGDVVAVHEYYAALIINAAVTVVESVDGCVKLVVAADGHHH